MSTGADIPDELEQQIVDLSEGNPGAVTVLAGIINARPNDAASLFDTLDEMRLRGSRIWLGYKDHCGEDIERFIACVESTDDEMISLINDRSRDSAPDVRTP